MNPSCTYLHNTWSAKSNCALQILCLDILRNHSVCMSMARTKATHRRSQARRLQRDIRRAAITASTAASPAPNTVQESGKENVKSSQQSHALDLLGVEVIAPGAGTSATQPIGDDAHAQAEDAHPETPIHGQGADIPGQGKDTLNYAEPLQNTTETQITSTDASHSHN